MRNRFNEPSQSCAQIYSYAWRSENIRKEGKSVHFASLMDICHLKNSELEPQFRKYKGRVVHREHCIYRSVSGQNHGPAWRTWLFLFSEIVRSSSGRTFLQKTIREVLFEHVWEKVPNWECSFVKWENDVFLVCDDIKLIGKQTIYPMWELGKKSTWTNQHPSFTMSVSGFSE